MWNGFRGSLPTAVAVLDRWPHLAQLAAARRSTLTGVVALRTRGVPDVPGREHLIGSNECFELERLPGSIAIIGAGYIGMEFASIFNGLGVAVTVLYRGDQVLCDFDMDLRDSLAGDLAYSEQRILEMGMALATDPAVLILDEPTAGMSRDETIYIVDLIRNVTEGRTLLVVEHDMSVVFTLCDRISVLVYGEIIASGEPAAVRADKKVQEAYLGEEVH